jgi:hypothetical protein
MVAVNRLGGDEQHRLTADAEGVHGPVNDRSGRVVICGEQSEFGGLGSVGSEYDGSV